ncbi:MAG: hypothetical protein GY711_07555 [bacterium]|nr:hypothetical protein [bacterium]
MLPRSLIPCLTLLASPVAAQLQAGDVVVQFRVGSNQGRFQPPGSNGILCLSCGFQGTSRVGSSRGLRAASRST